MEIVSQVGLTDTGDFAQFLSEVREVFKKNMNTYGPYMYRTYEGNVRKHPFNGTYLDGFADPAVRQHHNCSCCRHWLRQVGDLVFIDHEGNAISAFWDETAISQEIYRDSVAAMRKLAESTPIVSVFFHTEAVLGQEESGGFNHFWNKLDPKNLVATERELGKHIHEINTDFEVLTASLEEYDLKTVTLAASLLQSPAAFSGRDRFADRAVFLVNVHERIKDVKHTIKRANIIRNMATRSPTGFARPRSTVLSVILDALVEGRTADQALKAFNITVDPLKYKRTEEEAVKKGQILNAERIFKELDLQSALIRRAARLEDVPADKFVWRPTEAPAVEESSEGGVFGKLLEKVEKKGESTQLQLVDGGKLTYVRFASDVLPRAKSIKIYLSGSQANFRNHLTQNDPEAKPLLHWDSEEARMPIHSYIYEQGVPPAFFNLTNGWHEVVAIIPHPHEMAVQNHKTSKGVTLIIPGAYDTKAAHTPLFPDDLRKELYEVRNVVESFGRSTPISDLSEGSLAGISIENNIGAVVRVSDGVLETQYLIDRYQ